MQLYTQSLPGGLGGLPGPDHSLIMDSFLLMNPEGTQTRLETYIHQMEPQNDNNDPNVFDWSKFHPDTMIRFIEDRDAFEQYAHKKLGMEPLSLLCYNVDWLKSNNPDDQIRDRAEWAEFAAAVVESYNKRPGKNTPHLKFAQIWNEPNFPNFHMGNRDAYYGLFNAAAERIHRDYPGVLVGGPTLTKSPPGEEPYGYMSDFIKTCGKNADYLIYHSYGESPAQIEKDIRKWTSDFRALPGKQDAKIMITETDFWIQGWEKLQLVLERQFRLIGVQDLVHAVHHFCCLAYNEGGNYSFGVVDMNGGVFGGTFWPYWLFRNLYGNMTPAKREGPRAEDYDVVASRIVREGRTLATAVFHNKSDANLPINTTLAFEPDKADRVLTFARLAKNSNGIEKALRVPAGTNEMPFSFTLKPGEACALTLQDSGRRFFAFSDLDNQEGPWISLEGDCPPLSLGEVCQLHARILNTNFQPISGRIALAGLPAGWKAEVVSGQPMFDKLRLGQSRDVIFQFKAISVVEGRDSIGPYAVFEPALSDAEAKADKSAAPAPPAASAKANGPPGAQSLPVSNKSINPLSVLALPSPIQAVAGDTNQVDLQITNQVGQEIAGKVALELPAELIAAPDVPREFKVPAHKRTRLGFTFAISENVKPGEYKGAIVLRFLGLESRAEFTVALTADKASKEAISLELGPYANFDAVAYDANRTDYTNSMGMFVYPADFTPSARIVRVRGVPYSMLSMDDGQKNVILPKGQKIPVPPGKYTGVAFMGFGHDGKHPGTWIFHYEDGTSQQVASQIPEWCTPPPEGFQVAFRAPYRYIPGGPADPPCELFTWTLPADSSKTLSAIELPTMEKGAYIFAITLRRD